MLTVIGGLFFLYLYIQILTFDQSAIVNPILGGMYFVLFGIHEASHIVLGFMPAITVAAAGSLSEIAFTLILVAASFKYRSYAAASFSLLWTMLAMVSAGRYMADAKNQFMPLIGPGPNPLHDWNFVFTELDLLDHSNMIGDAVRYGGYAVGAIGLMVLAAYAVKLILSHYKS